RMQAPPEARGRRGQVAGGPPPDRGSMRGRAARRQGVLGWLGTLPGSAGIGIVAGSALLGAVITVVLRRDPGTVLGVLLVLGTIVAGLAVRTRSARLIIPVPVFCYVPTAVIAGAINDRSVDTSKIGLIIHGGKWISSGFTAMTFATIVAIVITGIRLFLDFRTRPRTERSVRAGRTGRAGQPGPRPRGPRPLVKDRLPPGQNDVDGLTRPMGQVGLAPTGPMDGRAAGARRQPPGSGGYPQAPGSGSGPGPGSGSGGYPQPHPSPAPQPNPQPQPHSPPQPQPQGTGPYPRPQGPGPYPQPPRPGQQGSGPYPPQRGQP